MRPTAEQLAQLKAECLQAAQDIETTDSTDFNADPVEVLALVDEVYRLRNELAVLTGVPDENKRLIAEVERLKKAVSRYFGCGQRIQDLSDDCGLLEESNKKLQAEIKRLGEKCDDLAINGFQAKLKQLDEAREENETLRAEVERLRAERCIRSAEADGERIRSLNDELARVLGDWNAIVKASGSPTHGAAIGHVAAMRAEVERLRGERDQALAMLAGWCVAVDKRGTNWDDWNTHYKDAAYRAGPLRTLLDAAIAKVLKDNGYEPEDTGAAGGGG